MESSFLSVDPCGDRLFPLTPEHNAGSRRAEKRGHSWAARIRTWFDEPRLRSYGDGRSPRYI